MNSEKHVLAQVLDWIHPKQFQRCVARWIEAFYWQSDNVGITQLCVTLASIVCQQVKSEAMARVASLPDL